MIVQILGALLSSIPVAITITIAIRRALTPFMRSLTRRWIAPTRFLIAGATCVGIGTGLFYDPLLCRKVNAGIADYLAAEGFRNVAELTGTLT